MQKPLCLRQLRLHLVLGANPHVQVQLVTPRIVEQVIHLVGLSRIVLRVVLQQKLADLTFMFTKYFFKGLCNLEKQYPITLVGEKPK